MWFAVSVKPVNGTPESHTYRCGNHRHDNRDIHAAYEQSQNYQHYQYLLSSEESTAPPRPELPDLTGYEPYAPSGEENFGYRSPYDNQPQNPHIRRTLSEESLYDNRAPPPYSIYDNPLYQGAPPYRYNVTRTTSHPRIAENPVYMCTRPLHPHYPASDDSACGSDSLDMYRYAVTTATASETGRSCYSHGPHVSSQPCLVRPQHHQHHHHHHGSHRCVVQHPQVTYSHQAHWTAALTTATTAAGKPVITTSSSCY